MLYLPILLITVEIIHAEILVVVIFLIVANVVVMLAPPRLLKLPELALIVKSASQPAALLRLKEYSLSHPYLFGTG